MATQAVPLLSAEQYLEIERKAEFKSEYFHGEMFAMAGAREAHNLIAANVTGALWGELLDRPCCIYPSDMRVRVAASDLYTYPDVSVVCGDRRFHDERRDTLVNPNLIVEVLSPSTEAYDRGMKFAHYQTVESVKEYLLISSDRMRAELFTRQPDGRWLLTTASEPEDSIELQSIGCRLRLARIYMRVDLPSSDSATLR